MKDSTENLHDFFQDNQLGNSFFKIVFNLYLTRLVPLRSQISCMGEDLAKNDSNTEL